MAEITFKTITATRDGVSASTGKQTEVAFNENFALTKSILESLLSIAEVTVISNDITSLKVDTTTTPYTLYYTMDDPLNNPTWTKLVNVKFSEILGNPTDNIALNTALNAKANQTDFATLQTQVGGMTTTISNIQNDVADRVRTPHSEVLYMKYDSNTNSIQYSTNGSTWVDILSSGISFSGITGSASDNASLVSYVGQQISNALTTVAGTYATQLSLQQHISNTGNPHSVTKAQVGLGNVDNTSDLDKPISTAVQNALDQIVAGAGLTVYNMTPADYRNDGPQAGVAYFTSNSFSNGGGE